MRKFSVLVLMLVELLAYGQLSNASKNSGWWEKSKARKEQITSVQISKETLGKLSTHELLEACLNYPYLLDIAAYGNFQLGFNTISSDFNGFKELYKRGDIVETILEKISELPSRTLNLSTSRSAERGIYSMKYLVLEYLMNQDAFLEKLNGEQKSRLARILQKNDSVMRHYPNTYGVSLLTRANDSDMSVYLRNLLDLNNKSWTTNSNVKTRNGTGVIAYNLDTNNEVDFSSDEHDSIYTYLKNKYPSMEMPVGGESSKKYNCHGFAWHMHNRYPTDSVCKAQGSGTLCNMRIYTVILPPLCSQQS